MKEQPKGTVVIVPPAEPETPDHLIMRIFGMTPREYVEKLLRQQLQESKEQQKTA